MSESRQGGNLYPASARKNLESNYIVLKRKIARLKDDLLDLERLLEATLSYARDLSPDTLRADTTVTTDGKSWSHSAEMTSSRIWIVGTRLDQEDESWMHGGSLND